MIKAILKRQLKKTKIEHFQFSLGEPTADIPACAITTHGWAAGYNVPFSMQFQQDGKYQGWCSVTASSVGQEGRLLFIKDDVSGRHFLCDMDAEERFACIAGGHADKWARPPS